jgi:hypothetical protein
MTEELQARLVEAAGLGMGGGPVDTVGWGGTLIGVRPDRAGAAVGGGPVPPDGRERAEAERGEAHRCGRSDDGAPRDDKGFISLGI